MYSTLVITGLCLASLLSGMEQSGQQSQAAYEDSSQSYYVVTEEKSPTLSLCKIISFPRKVLFSPFYLLDYGLEKGLLAIEKRNLIIRGAYLFSWFGEHDIAVNLGGLGPGSGIGGGITVSRDNLFKSPLDASISAGLSTSLYQDYRVSLSTSSENGLFFDTEAEYAVKHRQVFYGLGPKTHESDTTFWGSEETFLDLELGALLGNSVKITGCANYQNRRVCAARNALPLIEEVYSELPGLDGAELASVAASVMHDSRDKPGDPFSGGTEYVSFGFSRDVSGQPFRFLDYTFEITRYFTLIREGRRVSVRLLYERIDPLENNEIPFFSMVRLGGGTSLRGYPEDRFWGTQAACLNLEYSYPIWRRWRGIVDAVIFADIGQVFEDFSDIHPGSLRKTYGGGLRVKSPNTVVLRLEVGRSPEGIRAMLNLSPPFSR